MGRFIGSFLFPISGTVGRFKEKKQFTLCCFLQTYYLKNHCSGLNSFNLISMNGWLHAWNCHIRERALAIASRQNYAIFHQFSSLNSLFDSLWFWLTSAVDISLTHLTLAKPSSWKRVGMVRWGMERSYLIIKNISARKIRKYYVFYNLSFKRQTLSL